MKHLRTIFVLFVLLGLLAALAAPVLAAPGDTTLVSLADDETQGNGDSYGSAFSSDARYVAFVSHATNLVADDTNGKQDVFVRGRTTGTTTLVSVATNGTQGNDASPSTVLAISSTGRFVAFTSMASNLVSTDTNAKRDIFVRDRDTDEDGTFDEPGAVATILVSMNLAGTDSGNDSSYNPSISGDGRYVAFYSDATDLVAADNNADGDIFVRDLIAGTTTRASVDSSEVEGNGRSVEPDISSDGRCVAFASEATNLVAVDTNAESDIFVRDLTAGETYLVSVATDSTQGDNEADWAAISGNGRYVAFASAATNLITGDTNGEMDLFVRDRTLGATTIASVASDGTQGNSIVDYMDISSDGRYVAFGSFASNLVANDTNGKWDVFLHDRTTGLTQRISVDSSGAQADGGSFRPSLSSDGSLVAFYSEATNLVAGDANGKYDVFVREPVIPATTFGPVSRWTTAFDLSHGWTVQNFVRTVGDVNNDQRADLVGFGQDGVYVALSTGTGFGAVNKWTSAFDLSHGWTVQDFVRTVGDVNKDGQADLIGFGQDGVYVALSDGAQFGAISKWTSAFDLSHGWTVKDFVRTVGDVNNDGRADLIGFGLDGVYVALSDGAQFGAIGKWTSAFDLSHGWTVQDFVRTAGDVNNDGRADLIGFGSDGVYVALSDGAQFGAIGKWTSAFDLSHGWTVKDFVRTVGDVNNDGQADLIGFGADGVYVALSTGTGFGAISKWTSAFDLSHGWTVQDFVRTVGDVNKDGNADLVGFGADGVYVALAQ